MCVCVCVCVCVCCVSLSVPGGLGCPAQMSPLQRRNSSGTPMQESPPVGKGESQRRSLLCLPAPHAAEHAVQSVHCDQPPAAAQGYRPGVTYWVGKALKSTAYLLHEFRAQELCEQGGGPGLPFLIPVFPRP